MNRRTPPLSRPGRLTGVTLVILGAYLVLVAVACSGGRELVKPIATPSPPLSPPQSISTATPKSAALAAPMGNPSGGTEEPSWVFLDDDFANASQLEKGAEVYRLVCAACHGDEGQGLTEEWRNKWNPKDRNCWQSKCHGEIHPPDGFVLPRYVPPVKGPIVPAMFDTALELYYYNKATMPWHAPGTMRDEEYWQVTAFMVELNGVDLEGAILDKDNAADISFNP